MRSLRHLLAVTAALVALMVVTGRSADSTYSAIQLQLADLLIAEERFPEALEAFARAKDGATPEQLFRARQGTVLSQLRLARFADARVEAELALAESPDDPEAIVMGGEALWAAGLFDEAEQAFEDGLALDPNVPRGHHGRAKALMSRNRLDEALEVAQHALSLSPRDGEFHHTVGSLYERMFAPMATVLKPGARLVIALPRQGAETVEFYRHCFENCFHLHEVFPLFVHKSLTRLLFVLIKKDEQAP